MSNPWQSIRVAPRDGSKFEALMWNASTMTLTWPENSPKILKDNDGQNVNHFYVIGWREI